jgi:large subunit ribosomal protein L29
MKASEIRELNDADLTARIAELENERFRLRFRGATEQLEDPLRQRHLRRDVARLKTVQQERATEAAAEGTTKGTAKGTAKTQSARGGKTARTAKAATGGTTTKATTARKAPAKKAATGAGR